MKKSSFSNYYTENDYIYGNICMDDAENLPKKFKNSILSVKTQYMTDKCVACALASLCEINQLEILNSPHNMELSPEFVYYYAKEKDELGENSAGTTLKASCDVLLKKGICVESLMPFNKATNSRLSLDKPSENAITDALSRRINGYARVLTVDEVKLSVFYNGGCVILMRNYKSTLNCKDGFIQPPKETEPPMCNHAKLIFGYDDEMTKIIDGVKYTGFFYVLNSYGKNHADKGIEYMPYKALEWEGLSFNNIEKSKMLVEMFTVYTDMTVHRKSFKHASPSIMDHIYLKFKIDKDTVDYKGFDTKLENNLKLYDMVAMLPHKEIPNLFNCEIFLRNQGNGYIIIVENSTGNVIRLYNGSNIASINNKKYIIPKAPFIKDGKVMLSIRAIGEMLGCTVDHNVKDKEIIISRY